MALNITTLTSALQAAFLANLSEPTAEQTTQVQVMSNSIASAILTFVESATITYSAGLIAPPGGGPVTGVFGSTIS